MKALILKIAGTKEYRLFAQKIISFVLIILLTTSMLVLIPAKRSSAATTSVTWTTTSHFQNNGATGSNYTGATTYNAYKSKLTSDNAALADKVDVANGAMDVSSGDSFSIALMPDGSIKSWGANDYGQLGNGTTTESHTPVSVSGINGLTAETRATAIATGSYHALALMADGTIKAWGANAGALGDGTTTNSSTPVTTSVINSSSAATRAKNIAAGGNHSLAIMADGSVKAWGINTDGQLGDTSTTTRTSPVDVSTLTGSTADVRANEIAGGANHSLAVMADGSIKAWGDNSTGQIGDNDNPTDRTAPVSVDVIDGSTAALRATKVAAYDHSLAIMADGTLKAWGKNANGQIGDNSTTQRNQPVTVDVINSSSAALRAKEIAAGRDHSTAIMADGSLKTWGYNNTGQLGDNSITQRSQPVVVSNLDGTAANVRAQKVSAGTYNTLALTANGLVKAWGGNTNGQLGDDSTTQRNTAISVSSIDGFDASLKAVSISTGYDYTLALMADGTIKGWGLNDGSQLGDGTTTQRNQPVNVAGIDGSTAATRAVAVEAGFYHGLAIMADGSVKAWGANWYGQIGDNTITDRSTPVVASVIDGTTASTRAVAIAAGEGDSLALMADGTVKGWGDNGYGNYGTGNTTEYWVPTATMSFLNGLTAATRGVAISAGSVHSHVLLANGASKGTGDNVYGQVGDNTTVQRTTPVEVNIINGTTANTRTVAYTGGSSHTQTVMADGTAKGWGSGRIGDGTAGGPRQPTDVIVIDSSTAAKRAIGISAANSYSLALMADGTVKGWGLNANYNLGDNTNTTRSSPVDTLVIDGSTPDKRAIEVSTGPNHSTALMANGAIKAWGANNAGQIGDNTTTTRQTPTNTLVITGGGLFTNEHASPATISGFKIDAGSGETADWSAMSWNNAALPANTAIKFRTRGASTEAGLTSASWSSYYTTSGSSVSTANSRWLEVVLTLESTDGADTPTLNDFTVSYELVAATDTTAPQGSIAINNGDVYTKSTAATLNFLNVSDPGSVSSGVTQVIVSENADFSGASWKPYTSSLPFILSGKHGNKTVYMKLKDGSGNESVAVSDSINLDTGKPKMLGYDLETKVIDVKKGKTTKIYYKVRDRSGRATTVIKIAKRYKKKNYGSRLRRTLSIKKRRAILRKAYRKIKKSKNRRLKRRARSFAKQIRSYNRQLRAYSPYRVRTIKTFERGVSANKKTFYRYIARQEGVYRVALSAYDPANNYPTNPVVKWIVVK